jgi:hypothetical protein
MSTSRPPYPSPPIPIGTLCRVERHFARYVTPDFRVRVVEHESRGSHFALVCETVQGGCAADNQVWGEVDGIGTVTTYGRGRLVPVDPDDPYLDPDGIISRRML